MYFKNEKKIILDWIVDVIDIVDLKLKSILTKILYITKTLRINS